MRPLKIKLCQNQHMQPLPEPRHAAPEDQALPAAHPPAPEPNPTSKAAQEPMLVKDEEDDLPPETMPPPMLTMHAIDSTLRRIFKPRQNGEYQVAEDWVKEWGDLVGGGRDRIRAMFEKLGYEPARVY